MPVMDGYEATRTLRSHAEYARDCDEGISIVEEGDSTPELDHQEQDRDRENAISGSSPTGGAAGVSVEKGRIGTRGKGYLRDIPVIAMTASAIQGDREKCHEAGMDDYLAKPVEKTRLEEMLVKWADRKRN